MDFFDTHMIDAARVNLRSHVLKTPLVHSQTLSRRCGCRVNLKMEYHTSSIYAVKTSFWS